MWGKHTTLPVMTAFQSLTQQLEAADTGGSRGGPSSGWVGGWMDRWTGSKLLPLLPGQRGGF